MRSVRLFIGILVLLCAERLVATTDFKILFDVDNRTSTGCSVNGMAGVERVVTTVVETTGTPRVTSVNGQVCTAGALGAPVVLESTGWPIEMNGTSGELSIETRVPASFFGGTIPAGMRLGFVASSGAASALVLETLDGTPILFPVIPSRRRIIGAGTAPSADGNDSEWSGVQPLTLGGTNGTPSLRLLMVQGWFGGNQMFFRFGAQSHPDAPTAVNDSYSTTPGTPITVAVPGVLSNDTDPRGRTLTAALVSGVNHGALVLNADGSFSYSDDGSGAQRDHFTYRASNGEQLSNVARVDIGVSARPNTRPNAGDDTYAIGVGETLIIPPPGVLSNDNDPDADTITAILGAAPSHGTVTLNSNGSFTYVHNGAGSGADSFTYFAFDGMERSREATVHLTIQPNIPPLALNDAYTVAEGGVLNVPARGVLTNDSDADGSALLLTASLVTGPSKGTLTLGTNGGFVYVHNGSESASDSFTYRAFDGRAYSNIATVTIAITPVNDAPVAAGDAYTTAEDTPLNVAAPGVLGNDSDPEGAPMTAALASGASNGTVTLNANGSFLYTPNANFNGTDSFSYTASDGALVSAPVAVTITVTPVNDAPTFTLGGNITVAEDSGPYAAIQATAISAGPADEAGQTLTFNVTNNNNALFGVQPVIAADGTLTFTPAANANGVATVTVTLSDNGGGTNTSAPQMFTITVTAVNDAPSFSIAGNQTVAEDSGAQTVAGFATGMSPGPADEAGQTLSFNTTNDNNALFAAQPTVALDGTLTYTPAANAFGTANVTVTLSDNGTPAGSTVLMFTITITPVNDLPVAAPDAYNTNEDTALVVAAPGVLANDTDVEGALTAILVTGPANGTLTLNADGSFTYTPNPNYNGADSFTYKANDGTADSGTVTVSITVNAVNDLPVAAADAYTTNEDTPLVVPAPGVLGNDTDVEGSALTAVLVTGPASGTLTLNADGSFTYTPGANFNGTDSFTYRANDGTGLSAAATVTITVTPVNDLPVAAPDAYNTNEDTALVVPAPGVLANDTDVEGALTAILVTGPANGTLTLNADGSFTYTPNVNYNGADSFTYKANDGSADSGTVTVTITVNAVNDLPVAAADAYTTAEDTPLVVAAPGVLGNDTDVEGSALTAVLVTGPASGTLTLSADGSFTYTPGANFNGTDSFTYRANDGTGLSAAATVTITVTPVNDLPVAAPDAYNTNEDTALVVPAPGVLANDTDVEGALTAILVTGPANGTLTLNADGSFTYTPNVNYNGADSFTYKANDGSADSGTVTVSITVNAVNDLPVAAADAYTTAEDTPLVVAAPGVLGNDSDVEGSALTAVLVTGPGSGTLTLNADGSFTYTPNVNFSGTDSFTYRANDGTGLSAAATVTITVTPVQDAPTAAADSYNVDEDTALNVSAPGVLANDSDPDGDPLSASLVAGPANGLVVLNPDGSFSYTPSPNFNGSDSFTYRASDGTLPSAPTTVTITVNPVNDAPVASDDSYNTNEDTALIVPPPGVLGNDSDVDLTLITPVLVAGPSNGSLTLNPDGSFIYTPNVNFFGIDSFTYRASDGTATSNIATVTITVNPTPDAPIANNDSYATNEDTPLNVSAPGVLGNDADPDGNPLTAVLVTGPANGTLTLNADGSFTYAPNANFNGSDSFTYKANDGTLDSLNATVTITINPVNDAPTGVADAYNTFQNVALNVPAPGVLANDTDLEGNPLTAVLVSGPANGTVALNADGSFLYTPNAGYNGPDSFIYTANDGTANSANTTVSITVSPNTAPTAVADAYAVNEDNALNVAAPGVLGNDTDPEVPPQTLSAVLMTGPSNGTLTLNADGSFLYTPSANFNGTDTFQYAANDGATNGNTVTVTITVNAVNDAPVLGGAGSTVGFTENGSAVTLEGAITVADVDLGNLQSATVTITANYQSGADVLSFTPIGAIVGSFNAGTGVLSLSGAATAADYQTALRSVTYVNTSESPTTTARTISWVVNDGTVDSNTVTTTVNVTAVNDAPVATAGGTLNYTENQVATAIDTTITVSDVDNLNLVGATVQITGNLATTEDVLSYAPALGINGSYNAATGTLTLTGTTTRANYETALRNVLYNNTSENPSTLSRTVTWIVNDGEAANNLSIGVTSTINVTAVNDAPTANAVGPFAAQAGIPISFPAATLGGTDAEPGTTVTVSTTPGTVTNGTVTINADGSFTFTPSPASAGGTASFQYNVCDDGTPAPSACSASPATVTLNVAGPSIYFVKIGNVGLANCTLGNECALSTALIQIGLTPDRRIFLGDNGSYTQTVSLNTNGWIIGQGVTGASFDAVFGIVPPGAGTLATRPAINQPRPTLTATVAVAGGTRVRGLDISTTLGAGLTESSVGAINDVLINDASISGTNSPAIILTDVTTLAASLTVLSSSSSPSNAVSLTNVTGSLTAAGGTLTNANGAVINVAGGSVGMTYSGNVSQGNNFPLMSIGGAHTGTLTFNTGTVSATNGTGLQFSNADGTYQFQGTTTLNGGDAGIDVTNNSTGTFTFNASTQIGNTSSPSGVAFHINNLNSTTTVTYNGTINTTTNRPVHVQNVGANSSISFTGNVTSTSNGILLQTMANPTSVTFSGASKSLNVGANTAVQMDGAAGNTVTFSGGGLVISRTTGAGIAATTGGTLIITGSGNIINSGSGTALNVSNVTIGAGGLVFQAISQNGGASAIVLNNTGSTAGLTVSGNGGTCSTSVNCTGGALLNATADAISLTTTNSPSFTRMFIQNASGSGIEGTGVVNFTFQDGVIDNVGTGGGANESNIAFKTSAGGLNENNLSGAVNILRNSLTNSRYHGIDILNYSGTISDLQITNNTLTSSTSAAASLGNAILVDINGNAAGSGNVTKGSISNNIINNFPSGAGIRVDSGNADAAGPSNSLGTPGNATNILNVTGNSVSGAAGVNMATQAINVTVSGKGQGNVNIANNNPVTNMNGAALACSGFGQVTLTCAIAGNTIVANNVLASVGISAGAGQQFSSADAPDVTVTITGNNVSATNGVGIWALTNEGNAVLKAKIQNNTVAAPTAGVRPGIRVDSGAAASINNTVCLNISGNTSAGSGGHAGIGLRKQGTVTTTHAFGINGMAATSSPGVEAYVNGLNPAGGGTLLISATSGFSNCSLP